MRTHRFALLTPVTLAFALTASWVALAERDARACGGCFSPPTEQDSVVTDHRMILSVSSTQTTLYDQIRYTGKPSSFAWVLPINGQAKVGLSADIVFSALDGLTATQVQQPPTRCPSQPNNCNRGTAASAGASADGAAAPPGVTVITEEVVGPYETVQLSATTPTALNDWLAQHGYNIPSDVAPILAAYQQGNYDFLALKLVPGASVQSMRPVRVTTAGGSPVLPLRMVTAGTGATVGITLWVIAEGRYEPQNFAHFEITSDQVVWDWATSSSNFKTLRAAKSDGKTWEIESSMRIDSGTLTNRILYPFRGPFGGGGPAQDAGVDYLPVTAADGGVTETPSKVRDEDIATLYAGINPQAARVTRMRADVTRANLNVDLNLQAARDQSELSSLRVPTQEAGQPQCTIYSGCDVVGQGPRDQAMAAQNSNGKSSFSCATSTSSTGAPLALLTLAGFLGLALVRSRKKTL